MGARRRIRERRGGLAREGERTEEVEGGGGGGRMQADTAAVVRMIGGHAG